MASTSHNELSVNEDVDSVDDDHGTSHEWIPSIGEWEEEQTEEGANDLHSEQDDQSHAQEWTAHNSHIHGSEAGIDAQSNGDDCGETDSQDDVFSGVEGADEGEDVGPADGEDTEEDVVGWSFSSYVLAAGNGAEDEELEEDSWSIKVPGILDPLWTAFNWLVKQYTSEGQSKLSSQDSVNLAHESQTHLVIRLFKGLSPVAVFKVILNHNFSR